MHELLLFASVPAQQHHELLQQLAGLTAMQPRHRIERHLIFKAHRKPGQINPRVGGSQDLQASEMQRLTKMLNGGMYYTQVVGPVNESNFGSTSSPSKDVAMHGVAEEGPGNTTGSYDFDNQQWRLEFRDIPEAGTRTAVTSRLMANATLPRGDVVTPMNAWGYSFVTEYILEGDVFIYGDIVIFLHRVLTFPPDSYPSSSVRQSLPPLQSLSPLDSNGGYLMQAAVTVQEGSNPQIMKTATERLFGFKEQMKTAVKLEQADRLSLDTRVK